MKPNTAKKRTHGPSPALANETETGYNKPVVQHRCCAEWPNHSYRAGGC